MKIGFWILSIFIVLEVSVILTPTECFTIPISVSTGMAIIMALVKIKAVIIKVILGLKAMGYESLVWRTRKRRSTSPHLRMTNEKVYEEELLEAWNDLQQSVGKVIQFDLQSCISAANSSRQRNDSIIASLWVNVPSKNRTTNKNYSTWVSRTLGSTIKDPFGCQILHDEIYKSSHESSNS